MGDEDPAIAALLERIRANPSAEVTRQEKLLLVPLPLRHVVSLLTDIKMGGAEVPPQFVSVKAFRVWTFDALRKTRRRVHSALSI